MKLYPIVIIAFVFGVILTVFGYQAYTIYELRATVDQDHAAITQVVGFLNSQIQAASAGSQGQQQAQRVGAPSQAAPAQKK